MKTTYPKSWKGITTQGSSIEGPTLTTDGCGNYGISQLSIVETAIAHLSGWDIKLGTLQWLCNVCRKWNCKKEIKCNHCNAILDKFKDNHE